MSKFKTFNFEKKDEIEMEKMETGTNIDKSALSGILSKSKNSKKEEIFNKSMKEKPLPEKDFEIKSSISNAVFIKTPQNSKFKKYKSDNTSGYFTFNNNTATKPLPMDSEQERFDKIKYKTTKFKNNNIIKRVREFVPAKEYLNLLDELDEEEEEMNIDIKNSKIKDDSKIDKDNNNSENQNLNNIEDKKINGESKSLEELKDINKIIETNNEEIKNDQNFINKKVFDIYNIDINLDCNSKKENNEKENDLLYSNLYDKNLLQKNFYKRELIKEKKELKFKKEFYDNFSIYTTNILFKYGEYNNNINNYQKCVLLLRKPFLYVLNPSLNPITEESVKFFNPDISLINYIEKKSNIKNNNNYILKNKFNLSSPLLSLNFNLLSCILLINKNININEFQIMILGKRNKFSFIINDKEIFNKYIYLIQNIIKNTEGSHENKLGLSLRNNNFYKEIYITVSDFERQAKTGDLLLFKTIDTCANCQRFFTCDNYDHVGIILNKNKKIYIFESTSLGKCTPLSWNSFVQLLFNLVYYKIAYRKLNYENKNDENRKKNMQKLEENCKSFIEEIKGKDYYLSIPRFLCCKTPDNYEYEKDWNKAKGLCCSALAAAIYIKVGVIKLEKSVHSTRPGDFEHDRNRITFEEGYSLGPEKIIEFSE